MPKIDLNKKPELTGNTAAQERCGICGSPFDDTVHLNCGGDCLECMALVGGDPDLLRQLKPLWKAEALERMRDDLLRKCPPAVIEEVTAEIKRLRQQAKSM